MSISRTVNFSFIKIVSIFLVFSFSSCHLLKKEEAAPTQAKGKKAPKRLTQGIGEVVSINTDQQFVLIDVSRPKLASKANFFYVEKGSRRAVVNPTGEKIGHYYAADIVSGKVLLGDPVLVKLPKPPAPPEPEVKEETIVEEKAPEPKVTTSPEPTAPVIPEVKPVLPPEQTAQNPVVKPEATIKGNEVKTKGVEQVTLPVVTPPKNINKPPVIKRPPVNN